MYDPLYNTNYGYGFAIKGGLMFPQTDYLAQLFSASFFKSRPRVYKTWVLSQTQNKAQWSAATAQGRQGPVTKTCLVRGLSNK